jgi:hypothetical protein
MREMRRGTLRSGRSGAKVTSRKQAVAIGLSEARASGAKVPRRRKTTRKRAGTSMTGAGVVRSAKKAGARKRTTGGKSRTRTTRKASRTRSVKLG